MQTPKGVTVSVPLGDDLITKLEDFAPTVMSLAEIIKMALEEFFRTKETSAQQ